MCPHAAMFYQITDGHFRIRAIRKVDNDNIYFLLSLSIIFILYLLSMHCHCGRTVLPFFGASLPNKVHCLNCSFVSRVHQWIHILSTVTKLGRNSFGLSLNSVKPCYKMVSRLRLLSGVSKCGTHRGKSIPMANILYKIWPTRFF